MEEEMQKIEVEINKFTDIDTIFQKLRDQGSIEAIYNLFNDIFQQEHNYTLSELQKYTDTTNHSSELLQHFKLNSKIFKSNISLISLTIIDNIFQRYVKSVKTNAFSSAQKQYIHYANINEAKNQNQISPIKQKSIDIKTGDDEQHEIAITSDRTGLLKQVQQIEEHQQQQTSNRNEIAANIINYNVPSQYLTQQRQQYILQQHIQQKSKQQQQQVHHQKYHSYNPSSLIQSEQQELRNQDGNMQGRPNSVYQESYQRMIQQHAQSTQELKQQFSKKELNLNQQFSQQQPLQVFKKSNSPFAMNNLQQFESNFKKLKSPGISFSKSPKVSVFDKPAEAINIANLQQKHHFKQLHY